MTIVPPFPPQPKECKIDKQDACEGFEFVLAAGILNPEITTREKEGSAKLQGPAFKEAGQVTGFSGYFSNRYLVQGDPSACN